MTHPGAGNAQLEQVGVLLVHLAVNAAGVLLEHEPDVSGVDGAVDELDVSAIRITSLMTAGEHTTR